MNQTVAPNDTHPLAAHLETAAEAFRDGARDAAQAAQSVLPAASEAVGKAVYAASYYVSYGVCFAALLAYKAIPNRDPLTKGIEDGARDAERAVNSILPSGKTAPTAKKKSKSKPSLDRRKLRAEAARRARGEIFATAENLTSDAFLSE